MARLEFEMGSAKGSEMEKPFFPPHRLPGQNLLSSFAGKTGGQKVETKDETTASEVLPQIPRPRRESSFNLRA